MRSIPVRAMNPCSLLRTLRAAGLLLAIQTIAGGRAYGQAGQAVPVAPHQVVVDSMAHSLRLKMLDREVDAAGARSAQAGAQGLPLVTANAQAMHYTGLDDSSLSPFLVIPFIEDRYSAGVTLMQPLYTGGRITSQKQSADYHEGAVRHERRSAEADLILQALTAYWNWSKAFYSVESLKAAVGRMEAHARDMRNLQQAGLATDNDALATEVMLDQTRLRLEEAMRRVEVAAARITFLTGMTLGADRLPQKAVSQLSPEVPSEAALLEVAQNNRAERSARVMEAKAAASQVRAVRADYSPQVSLIARYEQARPNLLDIPPRDTWQDDAFIGISLSWSLFDWGLRRAKVAEVSARRAQARLQVEQAEEQISLEVREARINLEDACERITVADRVEQIARKNLTAATDLWQNGLARHSDVLDAHQQLTAAQYEVIAAGADAELARAALDHAVGLLKISPPYADKN